MTQHVWETENVDGGSVGCADFWVCRRCGASGGVAWPGKPQCWEPFYADGSGVKVSTDCDEAKRQIAEHVATWKVP